MGAPLTYDYTQKLFNTRRKSRDFKAYKTDTRLELEGDKFVFYHCSYNWAYDKTKRQHVRTDRMTKTPLVSITPDNVVTLLVGTTGWPSADHITIRNRLADITGFMFYSDTAHHKNKGTAIRIEGRYYDNGWHSQPWCAGSKSLPYAQGTQFKTITNGKNGGLTECLNPPKDVKHLVKQEAIQRAKAETAVIRKLAKVMLRVGFEEHLEHRIDKYWVPNIVAKPLSEVNHLNPTGDDATAVLAYGLRNASRPDTTVWSKEVGRYVEIDRETRIQILRERVLENGMRALRKHIYETTDGYDEVEVS